MTAPIERTYGVQYTFYDEDSAAIFQAIADLVMGTINADSPEEFHSLLGELTAMVVDTHYGTIGGEQEEEDDF